MTRAAVKQSWQVIDRITDAVTVRLLKELRKDYRIIVLNRRATYFPLIKGRKTKMVL